MSLSTILLTVYIAGAVISGYFFARYVYRDDGYRPPSSLQAGNLWTALFAWLVFGGTWPVIAVIGIIICLVHLCGEIPGKSVGDRIFGK